MAATMYALMILTGEIHRIPAKPTSASPAILYFHGLLLNRDQAVRPLQMRTMLKLAPVA